MPVELGYPSTAHLRRRPISTTLAGYRQPWQPSPAARHQPAGERASGRVGLTPRTSCLPPLHFQAFYVLISGAQTTSRELTGPRKRSFKGKLTATIAQGRGGGGCTHNLACNSHICPLTSHPYKAGTEHAGFSPDQARNQSPSAKRRDVFGESHEG